MIHRISFAVSSFSCLVVEVRFYGNGEGLSPGAYTLPRDQELHSFYKSPLSLMLFTLSIDQVDDCTPFLPPLPLFCSATTRERFQSFNRSRVRSLICLITE
ncbi:hypothetical protein XENORESO_016299 [Xenotaenia resolanae]|uniref:Secreted protein n=1 Tax=Xenotaenia resolanae TaxID=208358 RepID=A0ABV0VMW8_9TELE